MGYVEDSRVMIALPARNTSTGTQYRGSLLIPCTIDTMSKRPKIKPVNGPVRIDRLAEALLDPVVSKAGFSSTQILAAWPDIVGPDLAERSRPEKLRWPARRESDDGTAGSSDGATLVVRAEGGDAMELQYASAQIVAKINAIFGWRAVSRLSIRQAPVNTGQQDAQSPSPAPAKPAKPLDSGTAERIASVEDEELRDALARLGSQIDGD